MATFSPGPLPENAGLAAQPPTLATWVVPLLGGAFMVSGAAGLIHEVAWTRLLARVFGVSSYAVATVLGAYMGGHALGSAWMGRHVATRPDLRRVYGWLELGIGLFALLIPWILDLVEPFYGALWRRFEVSFAVATAVRLAIAGAILIVPTFLMGATLPALAGDLARRGARRVTPEWLYTLNLVGAVAGAAGGGFVLMPRLGLHGTIAVGAGLNLGVAIAVLLLPRQRAQASPAAAPSSEACSAPGTEPRRAYRPVPWRLLASALLSGLFAMATQVAWNRVLGLVVGSTTYAFTSVLLVYLTALALGGVLASSLARRPGFATRALAIAFVATALATLAAVAAADRIAELYVALYSVTAQASLAGLVQRAVVTAFAILLVPVLIGGTILPFTLAAATEELSGAEVGRAVGAAYAANTVGAIVGSLLAGFVSLPLIGTQRTLLSLGLIAVAGAIVAPLGEPRRGSLRLAAAGLAAVACVAAIAGLPLWRPTAMNAGVSEPGRHTQGIAALLGDVNERVLFQRDGRSTSVLVTDRPDGVRSMRIDARVNASDHPGDMATQILLAQIPLLLAPRIDDVFVVGWGSGVTVGAALQDPIAHLTAVELEPAVVESSRLFDHVNHRPLDDPRVQLYLDDARHILLASDRLYDVIISEPPHPWVAGVASLFTEDFYRLAASRLRPGGIFSHWLQTYELTLDSYRTVLATFTKVFPEAMVFYTPGTSDTILIGSREPLAIDLPRVRERWADPATSAELGRAHLLRPEHLIAAAVLAPSDVRAFAAGAPINTDDNMLLEFTAPAGSLSLNVLRPEIEARSSGLLGVLPSAREEITHMEQADAYADGLRQVRRDPERYFNVRRRTP